MNDTLKVAGRIGAELGAAKAENDRLREALSRIANLPMYQCSTENDYRLSAAKAMAVAALSKQAEPTDTYTAVDMATAAAQGFRDGQAAVDPAAAQNEREASRSVEHIVRALNASVAVGSDGDWVSIRREHRDAAVRMLSDLDADFRHVYQAYAEAQKRAARPAQTEQQPVEVMPFQFKHPDTGDAHAVALTRQEVADGMEDTLYEKLADLICHCEPVGETNVVDCNCDDYIYEFELVNAAPNAQTAPQPEQSGKFAMHQRVRKTSGSEWQGRICGTYSTALTPEGYAVESEAHAGSVQIYPAKALEAVE